MLEMKVTIRKTIVSSQATEEAGAGAGERGDSTLMDAQKQSSILSSS